MRRNGRRETARVVSALSQGLPLISQGRRLPRKLLKRGLFWLNRGAQTAQVRAFAALAPLGIDPRHFAVLTLIEEAGALSQRQISDALNVDPAMMVALVDDLERLSLVRREVRAEDRRAYAVRLTAAGSKRLAEAERRMDALEESLFGALSQEEYARLLDLLKKLHPGGCACGCGALANER